MFPNWLLNWIYDTNFEYFRDRTADEVQEEVIDEIWTEELRAIVEENKLDVADLLVEDLIGDVPKAVTDEALFFLAPGKQKFEKWLRWQAYVLQRRYAHTEKRPDVVLGSLIFLRTLLAIVEKLPAPKTASESQEFEMTTPRDILLKHLEGVEKFRQATLPKVETQVPQENGKETTADVQSTVEQVPEAPQAPKGSKSKRKR